MTEAEQDRLKKEVFYLKKDLQRFKETHLLAKDDWLFGQIVGGLCANPNLAQLPGSKLAEKARRILAHCRKEESCAGHDPFLELPTGATRRS